MKIKSQPKETEKDLQNYKANFERHAEDMIGVKDFAIDAIEFIVQQGLYVAFLCYRANKGVQALKEDDNE